MTGGRTGLRTAQNESHLKSLRLHAYAYARHPWPIFLGLFVIEMSMNIFALLRLSFKKSAINSHSIIRSSDRDGKRLCRA